MQKRICLTFLILALSFFTGTFIGAERIETEWGGPAELLYDSGFARGVMRSAEGGVRLFNMDLIQNDAPGAGYSEKGVYSDVVWGGNRARKILYLDDPRALQAWLVVFVYTQGKFPLRFKVNGNPAQVDNWDEEKCREKYRWKEFPARWLKKGNNTIELSCPEARSESEGWELYLARADEFESGGGDSEKAGETSFKSFDRGKSWKQSPFGPEKRTRAEYSVRLSLDRHLESGWLASPVVDLWKGGSQNFIVPSSRVEKARIDIRAEVPSQTGIKYYLRKGTSPDPHSKEWEPYELIGSGDSLSLEIEQDRLIRRYVQLKAVFSTLNPLKSPVLKSAFISAELLRYAPPHKNIHVAGVDNPPLKYSSVEWEWERWDRPEFEELLIRENIDEVIAGSRTGFDAQVKLADYVSRRWCHHIPVPEYPGWDALSILDRIDKAGSGGFCGHYNLVLAGLCRALGWQARHVNVVGHEVCEVWNDDYGKWICLDAHFAADENLYNYDAKTAEPQNMLELHNKYLDYYFPHRPIDWMSDMIKWMELKEEKPPVRSGYLLENRSPVVLSGFINAAFIRMVPRNNWLEKPFPRPLSHGRLAWWPWDGYINWYDSKTPPKRQYSWHTDRACDMWPDLNMVHVHAASSFANDRLFLRFETFTPNFGHYELNLDDTGWKTVGERYTWLLGSGRNALRVRAVNRQGVRGKPASIVINHGDTHPPPAEYLME